MKSFVFSLTALTIMVGLIVWYGFCLDAFSDEIFRLLESLPESPEACESAAGESLATCDRILKLWKEKELFIHLAIPFERMESTHEKLLLMRQYCALGDWREFSAHRALCLEETEILQSFERITAENLI